jgi:hypothetical protein
VLAISMARTQTTKYIREDRMDLFRDRVGVAMVRFCANPACSEEYRYAGRGKIIVVEHISIAENGNTLRERELFWLCQSCAASFNLITVKGEVRCVKGIHPVLSCQRVVSPR